MYRSIVFLYLLISCFFSHLTFADSYIIEKDLSYALTYYNKSEKTFLPLELSSIERGVVYAHLDVDEIEGRFFSLVAKNQLEVFINEKLVEHVSRGDTVLFPLSDFVSIVDRRFDLAIYCPNGLSSFEGPWILLESNQFDFEGNVEEMGVGLPFVIKDDSFYYLLIIAGVLVLAYLRSVKSIYLSSYFDVTNYFSRFGVDDYVILNPINGQSLLIWGVVSLFISLGLNFVGVYWMGEGLYLNILIGTVLLFGLLFVRYFLLVLLNTLYGNSKVVRLHFFENARFFSLLGVLVGGLVLTGRTVFVPFFVSGASILFLVFIISLLSKLDYKRMYLISYLCVSEILPFILLISLVSSL